MFWDRNIPAGGLVSAWTFVFDDDGMPEDLAGLTEHITPSGG